LGVTAETGRKVLLSLVILLVLALAARGLQALVRVSLPGESRVHTRFWVEARQYSGRVVTITNDRIFDEPVYNYTRDFPYLWEEMHVPLPYTADPQCAELIILGAARRHTVRIGDVSAEALRELRRRYFVDSADLGPRIYWRLTDNWLELSVRFVTRERGVREVKDAMSREILAGLGEAGIPVASATIALTDLPPVRVGLDRGVGGPDA